MPGDWLSRGKYDNTANAKAIRAPFLLLAGTADDTARFSDHGQLVFDAAPEPKALVLVPKGSHRRLPDDMGLATYKATIAGWIEGLPTPQ